MSARLSFTRSVVSVAVVSAATLLAGGVAVAQQFDQLYAPIAPPKSVDLGKVELGKKLYFDPRLSKSGFISCNSCHNLSMGGYGQHPNLHRRQVAARPHQLTHGAQFQFESGPVLGWPCG